MYGTLLLQNEGFISSSVAPTASQC